MFSCCINYFGRFYTYGTFPLENHLKFINENVLSKFTAISPGTEVPNEPQWDKPVSVIDKDVIYSISGSIVYSI